MNVAWKSRIVRAALAVLARTWRVRWINPEAWHAAHAKGRPVILVFWHGQLMPLVWVHRGRQITCLVSEHGDGEIIAQVTLPWGYRLVRGSTTRGAARALLGASRELDAGFDLAITPDGPRGPARSVAPGALVIGHRTGVPLLPIGVWASWALHLKSWDSFLIPLPFARVHVAYGTLIPVDTDSARQAAEEGDLVRAGIDAAVEAATP